MHLNVQSLTNKIEAIEILAHEYKLDVLCVVEHWLNKDNQNIYNIMASTYVRSASIHGGVCIFVQSLTKYKEIAAIRDKSIEKECEMTGIYMTSKKTIIIATYRSPDGNISTFLETLAEMLSDVLQLYNPQTNIIVAGDFNIDLSNQNPISNELINTMKSFGLTKTTAQYTRVTATSRTTIDNIFTNISKYSTKVVSTGISDHYGIHLQVSTKHKTETNSQKTRLLTTQGKRTLENLLMEEDWQDVNEIQTAENKYNLFMSKYLNIVNSALPIRQIRQQCTKKFTPSLETQRIKSTLQLIQESYNQLGGEDLKDFLKSYKEFYLSAIQNEKRQRYMNILYETENKQKKVWDIIKTETSKMSRTVGPLPPKEQLNDFFSSVAGPSYTDLPTYTNNISPAHQTFFLTPVTPMEIVTTINNLKTKTSMDTNYLNTTILKWSAGFVAEPLSEIINTCFEDAVVPTRMKVAKIIPIYKKGDPTDCSNYRPIAILPVFSKVLEATMLTRIMCFLHQQQILHENQYGFRKGRSTTDAVRSMLNLVWDAMENGEDTQAIMCDLSKAFDCVRHGNLLDKLESYGIRGQPLRLLKSYLHGRRQGVYAEGELSSLVNIDIGVAQGTLMGPMMFCLYMNDLPEYVSTSVILFADDTTLLTSDKHLETLQTKTERGLEEAEKWFNENGLKLNKDKTSSIYFTSKRNTSIEKTSTKLLGIMLDTRLTWLNHVDALVPALSTATYAIRRVRQIIGEDAALLSYHSLFHSRLTYGLELWGGSAHAERIFILQKKAVRAIRQVSWTTHCKPIFRHLNIITLPGAYIYQLLIRAKREASNKQTRGESTTRKLRNEQHLTVPFHRINMTSHQHRHLHLYNNLPSTWRAKPLNEFQRDMKKLLKEMAFYDVSEFVNYFSLYSNCR